VTFEQMWAELAPVGRTRSGGYARQPFTAAEREAHAWFLDGCARRGLDVVADAVGNTVAWWGDPSTGGAVVTGSHLDSVVDGGGYDGALGVVAGLAAVDLLRDRGFRPARAVGVAVFVEEEGSRFGVPCLGSRLATGALDGATAVRLRDADGVALGDVLPGDGDLAAGVGSWLGTVGAFVELHVEQGRDLVHRGAPVAVGEGIWPHGRYRFDLTGEPNHAGTTRMEDRHDPMLTYAMTVLAANKQARLSGRRATFGRVAVHPNGTNAVPATVTGWLDARASSTEELVRLVADVERLAVERGGRDGVDVVVIPESVSPAVAFDRQLAGDLAAERGWPVVPTAAGHDAGVLVAAGIPATMLFVRNPTGVSHSPREHAETADCLVGVEALADVLTELAGADAGAGPGTGAGPGAEAGAGPGAEAGA
jgi:N-carbamoyl-L-amino-acid hydrolase